MITRLALASMLMLTLAACGSGNAPAVLGEAPEAPEQPTAAWTVLTDGAGSTAWGTDVTAIADGSDAIAVGSYIGTVTLAAGTPEEVSFTSTSWQDSYLARFGAEDGALQWTANLQSSAAGWVVIQDVVETPAGIAVVGYYDDALTFYDNAGVAVDTLAGDTVDDGFIAHYAPDGTLQWTRSLTSSGYVECLAVGVRPDGTLLVAGLFDASMTPGEPGDTMVPAGTQDGFLATYAPSGEFMWARQYESAAGGFVTPWSIESLDSVDQDIVIAGEFQGTADFGANGVRSSVDGTVDAFLLRVNGNSGDLEWVRTIGGPGREQALDLGTVTSGNGGHIRLTGGFEFTTTFGEPGGNPVDVTSAGQHDGFVAAFNADGSVDWVHGVGGPGNDYLSDAWVRESDGALIAIGYFAGSAGFSNSDLTVDSHGDGDIDALLAGFAPDGDVEWAVSMGGSQDDYGLGISGIPGAEGDVYATGMVVGADVSFGPGSDPVDVQGDGGAFHIRFKKP